MELRFWIDPETDLPHIFDHGVTEEDDHSKKPGVLAGWDEERLSARGRSVGTIKP